MGGYDTPEYEENFLKKLVSKYPLFDLDLIMEKAIDFHEYDGRSNPVRNSLRAMDSLCRSYEEWKWREVRNYSEEEESEPSI